MLNDPGVEYYSEDDSVPGAMRRGEPWYTRSPTLVFSPCGHSTGFLQSRSTSVEGFQNRHPGSETYMGHC